MPTLGWGKHSPRLYAGRISGRCPVPQPPRGRKDREPMKRKTAIVTIRMTPKVKEQLRQRAQAAGMTLTDYLCICGLWKEIVRVDGLEKVLSELKAQGRNLNQLTTLANMGKVKTLRGDDLVNGYTKLYQQVSQITEEVR